MTEEITLLVAFMAGLLSFLSPCVLPLVPVYLASLCGPGVFESGARRPRMPVFLHALSFVIGFSIVFSLWGAGAGLIGSALVVHLAVIRRIVGGILIAFGIIMLAALKVPWLNFERRVKLPMGSKVSYLRSLLTGGIFCLAWTPCLGWQISGILSLAGSSGTVWRGTYLMAVYSLGLGLPFLIMGVALEPVTRLLKRIHRYSWVVYLVSGVLLIAAGILVLTNRLVWY